MIIKAALGPFDHNSTLKVMKVIRFALEAIKLTSLKKLLESHQRKKSWNIRNYATFYPEPSYYKDWQ